MNPTATELYQQFLLIENNFGRLLQGCTTDAQREQVRTNYVQARRHYNEAILQVFDSNQPRIASLQAQLANGQQQIENAVVNLENISQTLDTISQVVSIGASLVLAAG